MAFVLSRGTVTNLDIPNATGDSQATDINNNGQIVGVSGAGAIHGFLAVPVSQIREPSSLAVFIGGVIGLSILGGRACRPRYTLWNLGRGDSHVSTI
jgi:uncharacterized membrane protein